MSQFPQRFPLPASLFPPNLTPHPSVGCVEFPVNVFSKANLGKFGRVNALYAHQRRELDVKVRSSVKPICEHCKVIKRQGVTRIICKRNPKHKQKQG